MSLDASLRRGLERSLIALQRQVEAGEQGGTAVSELGGTHIEDDLIGVRVKALVEMGTRYGLGHKPPATAPSFS